MIKKVGSTSVYDYKQIKSGKKPASASPGTAVSASVMSDKSRYEKVTSFLGDEIAFDPQLPKLLKRVEDILKR